MEKYCSLNKENMVLTFDLKKHFSIVPFYFHIDFGFIENINIQIIVVKIILSKSTSISNQDTLFKILPISNKTFLETISS